MVWVWHEPAEGVPGSPWSERVLGGIKNLNRLALPAGVVAGKAFGWWLLLQGHCLAAEPAVDGVDVLFVQLSGDCF